MKLTSRFLAVLPAALVIFAAPEALAQQGGSIRGTVTNTETHAPISGARIALRVPERIAITDERGTYVIRDVPAGSYKVYASAMGRAADSSAVSVSAGSPATHNIALAQGSLMLSSVIVSATRTSIEASKVAATVNVLT